MRAKRAWKSIRTSPWTRRNRLSGGCPECQHQMDTQQCQKRQPMRVLVPLLEFNLLADRYEFLLYKHLRHGLEAGDIFCRDSVRFRSMEDDPLDDKQWRNKDMLIAEAGLNSLQQPVEKHLAELKEQLETRIAEVNRRIATGENEHFKIKSNGRHARWTLEYPGDSEAANHPLFDQLPQADISSVLHFANRQCRFMD